MYENGLKSCFLRTSNTKEKTFEKSLKKRLTFLGLSCILHIRQRETKQTNETNAAAYGVLAQLGEHLPYKQRVIGSSPIGPIPIEYGGIAQLARAYGSYP